MSLLGFDEALDALLKAAQPLDQTEVLPLQDALQRVLAVPLVADLDVPAFDNSSMDGYALRCADVSTAGQVLPLSQRIAAGDAPVPLLAGTAARIFTGAPIPAGADAVVMQEDCEALAAEGLGAVRFKRLPQSHEAIRRAGEDIARGHEVLAAGRRLGAVQLGLAASIGCAEVKVFRRLRVGLVTTGNELVMPGICLPSALPQGSIFNSNRFFLQALIGQLGCEFIDLGVLPDDFEQTRSCLQEAAGRCDVLLSSGGVSVGEEDHLKAAVEACGELALWRLAIKPGKPLAFGQVSGTQNGGQQTQAAYIGLPGNPVASFVTFVLLVRPYLLKAQGMAMEHIRSLPALELPAAFAWPRAGQRREFLRARRTAENRLELYPNQSSGVLTSVDWADGLIDLPAGHTVRPGDCLKFLPLQSLLHV